MHSTKVFYFKRLEFREQVVDHTGAGGGGQKIVNIDSDDRDAAVLILVAEAKVCLAQSVADGNQLGVKIVPQAASLLETIEATLEPVVPWMYHRLRGLL